MLQQLDTFVGPEVGWFALSPMLTLLGGTLVLGDLRVGAPGGQAPVDAEHAELAARRIDDDHAPAGVDEAEDRPAARDLGVVGVVGEIAELGGLRLAHPQHRADPGGDVRLRQPGGGGLPRPAARRRPAWLPLAGGRSRRRSGAWRDR